MMSPEEIMAALAAPFPADVVRWRPHAVSKDKKTAMAVAFIDARTVMDRLDQVVGIENWKNETRAIGDNEIICRLSLKINGEWIGKEDVGGQSAQPDKGDREKSAFSAALKRAAVLWGIGRYLYRLKSNWLPINEWGKFLQTPPLPSWAIPPSSASRGKSVRTAEPAPVAQAAQADQVDSVATVASQTPPVRPNPVAWLSACSKKAFEQQWMPNEHALAGVIVRIMGTAHGEPSSWGDEAMAKARAIAARCAHCQGDPDRGVTVPELKPLLECGHPWDVIVRTMQWGDACEPRGITLGMLRDALDRLATAAARKKDEKKGDGK